MSISLPNNKEEKKARYRMLIKQGSMSWQEAIRMYKYYLTSRGIEDENERLNEISNV